MANKIVKDKKLDSKTVEELAALLINDGRKHQIDMVMADTKSALYEKHQVLLVDVHSKNKLTKTNLENVEKLLKSRFDYKQLIINQNIDENIIGGVKINVLDTEIDLTINRKLKMLKANS